MALTDDFDADLAEVTEDLPSSFVWEGDTYACLSTDPSESKELQMGGFLGDVDLSVIVRTSLFDADHPQVRDFITWNGVEYRIVSRIPEDATGAITLMCSEKTG